MKRIYSCAYICTHVCPCLSLKRFVLLKRRSVKSGSSLSPALQECEHMDFSEAVPFQDNTTDRKIRPEVIS